jgi:hypothetical protein
MRHKIVVGIIISIVLAATTGLSPISAQTTSEVMVDAGKNRALIATSGENIYTVWWSWSNQTGHYEVMFRASVDGGQTFSDKINLSNTTDAESVDAQIAASGDSVFVTWWEQTQTANEPVMMISHDNGMTFGPLLRLAANGTIG